jgi:HSP20 family protein
MSDLTRWGGRDLSRFQSEADTLLNSLFNWSNPEGLTTMAWPKADIYEDQEGLRMQFEVAGLDPNDVKVQINENVITVSGDRKLENEEKKNNYRRIERSYGHFERSFSLPQNLDTERVQAGYKNGVLNISIPRSERSKPRAVQVKVEPK